MRYKCDMIRDLMPLCVDHAASKDSENIVMEHISECKECEKYYGDLVSEIAINIELPEESKGYLAIANKIRKKNLLIRAAISIITGLIFFLLVSFGLGFRLSPEAAAALSGKLNASSTLIGQYDWGEFQFYIYDSQNSYETVTVQRYWNGWKSEDNYLVWPKYQIDKGSIINAGYMYFWSDTNEKYGIQLLPVIAEDERVAQIDVTVFNQTKSIDVEPGRLMILTFENADGSIDNEIQGYAYDSEGNVLYELMDDDDQARFVWQLVK